jgi:sulfoxide reductase heme-binding subunit YedZ
LTSSRYWQKKLKKNWQRLHWLIYAAGLLVILHFALSLKGNIFLFKGNVLWPLITLAIYLVLMTFRLKPIRHLIGLIRRSNSNS